MSTSLLYWQQGIRVYRHQKIERLKGGPIPTEKRSRSKCGFPLSTPKLSTQKFGRTSKKERRKTTS